MKMNKKKLLSLSLVIVLIAIMSFGTLAWFSADDEVTNKFYVASSDDTDPDDIFSIDLQEKVDTDGDGIADDTIAEGDGEGEEYKDILPGDLLVKEPVVVNTGYYDQYVRVKVTISDAAAWKEILAEHEITDLATIFKGYESAKWIRIDDPIEKDDTLTYIYYLQRALTSGESETLFTHVEIPSALTQQDLAKVGGGFELTITAEAVQTENVGANALEAFQTAWPE